MAHPRHLLLITPGFAQNEADQLCIPPLQAYVRMLRQQVPAMQLSILSLHYPFRKGTYLWHDQQVHSLGGRNRRWRRPVLLWEGQRYLGTLHRHAPVDMVHSFWLGEASWLAHRAAERLGIRHLATIMGQDALPGNRYLRKLPLKQLQVAAISDRAADAFVETTHAVRPMVVPWGLPPEERVWPEPGDRPIDLLGVGSLVPVKRWDRFLRVVAMLREQHPQLRAVLIGEGPLRSQLEAQAQDLGLGAHLEMPGQRSRDQVLATMAQSRVLLHTADYEGQGMVMAEALGQGMYLATRPVGMAQAGPQWQIAADTFGLAESCLHWLQCPPPAAVGSPPTMEATVSAYLEVYGS